MPFKKILLEGDAAGGSHVILDGSTHTDSVVQTVSRGSLIYGNSTPKWDELVVGAANSVLWTDGTDVSWSAAPRLANIADTGGTNRITIATASPHVSIPGHLAITSTAGGSEFGLVRIAPTTTNVTNWQGVSIAPALTLTGNTRFVRALIGTVVVTAGDLSTGHSIFALDFQISAKSLLGDTITFANVKGAHASAFAHAGGTDLGSVLTVTNLIGAIFEVQAQVDSDATLTITNTYGLQIPAISLAGAGTAPTITTSYGIWIGNQGTDSTTNVYGLYMNAITAGTNRYGLYMLAVNGGTIGYLLELGGTAGSPVLRLKDTGTGGWTAAANETPLWIHQGATPTLRQLKTRVWDGTAGHGFTNGDLVCFLV